MSPRRSHSRPPPPSSAPAPPSTTENAFLVLWRGRGRTTCPSTRTPLPACSGPSALLSKSTPRPPVQVRLDRADSPRYSAFRRCLHPLPKSPSPWPGRPSKVNRAELARRSASCGVSTARPAVSTRSIQRSTQMSDGGACVVGAATAQCARSRCRIQHASSLRKKSLPRRQSAPFLVLWVCPRQKGTRRCCVLCGGRPREVPAHQVRAFDPPFHEQGARAHRIALPRYIRLDDGVQQGPAPDDVGVRAVPCLRCRMNSNSCRCVAFYMELVSTLMFSFL